MEVVFLSSVFFFFLSLSCHLHGECCTGAFTATKGTRGPLSNRCVRSVNTKATKATRFTQIMNKQVHPLAY